MRRKPLTHVRPLLEHEPPLRCLSLCSLKVNAVNETMLIPQRQQRAQARSSVKSCISTHQKTINTCTGQKKFYNRIQEHKPAQCELFLPTNIGGSYPTATRTSSFTTSIIDTWPLESELECAVEAFVREVRLRGAPFLSSAEPELLPMPAPPICAAAVPTTRRNSVTKETQCTWGGGIRTIGKQIVTDLVECSGCVHRTLEHADSTIFTFGASAVSFAAR